jgi:hypothetical protein
MFGHRRREPVCSPCAASGQCPSYMSGTIHGSHGMRGVPFVVLMLLFGSPCSAQSDPAEAQRLLRAGVEAANDGRWVEARRDFERAYELLPRGEILINLAAAQAQTDLLVEASESYRRALEAPELDETMRAEASAARDTVLSALPHLRVSALGMRDGDRIEIDGHSAQEGLVPINPGHHRVAIMRGDRELTAVEIEAERGRTAQVALSIAAPEPEAGGAPAARDPVPHILGIASLFTASAAFFTVDAVSLGFIGSCSSSLPDGTCAQRWALDEVGFGIFGAAAIATSIAAVVWIVLAQL